MNSPNSETTFNKGSKALYNSSSTIWNDSLDVINSIMILAKNIKTSMALIFDISSNVL